MSTRNPRGDDAMRGVAAAVVAAIMIGALYFGREVFVPIALAILLSFVLAPLVRLPAALHIPRGCLSSPSFSSLL